MADCVVRLAGPSEAELLAHLHGRCFQDRWEAEFIHRLLAGPGGISVVGTATPASPPFGFGIARIAADEAEILSLAVVPEARRRKFGRALLAAVCEACKTRGAHQLYLEVAESNVAARALYVSAGFCEVGRRKDYYLDPTSSGRTDALLLARQLAG